MNDATNADELLQRIAALEQENAMLRRDFSYLPKGNSVAVPAPMRPLFDMAEQTVNEYFRHIKMDPTQGTIEINDQRYVLVRASALSKDFLDTVMSLYADRGDAEAMSIGKNFLFDIAHVIGMNDARNFHAKMKLTDPIAKLSAGPVHFAYTGWAYVDILPESQPSPDENFYLIYRHPYSFEADSWVRSGKKANTAVCIMNAGYSSGWCEESFGIQLTAVEVSCTAKGDKECTFVMSPPHKIQEHLQRFHASHKNIYQKGTQQEIPTFFDRKRVEEEMQKSRQLAEESAKSKSDFVANMSHELRTPLGAIFGFTELLKKTALTPVQKDYLEAISSSGNNLLSIINDILDLSKLDAGKFLIEKIPFSITELLHSVQMMFAAKAKKKGLQFVCNVDAAVSYQVIGDPLRLTQILINLIGNAIKFTEHGGVYIHCMAEAEDSLAADIIFSVRDTGIGIPADKINTVFERFTQADTDITRKYGGTGLGLAITKQLVELQGGTITLKNSDSTGVEFLFTLSYPKSFEKAQPAYSRELNEQLLLDKVNNVLVVEDNLMNQKLATVILENNGFDVSIAENGSMAVEMVKQNRYDIILMDIQMPLMDGYQATAAIRNELHIQTPIIAMTAHALAGEKEKCIQAGMNDYLSKPYKEADLLQKISRWGNVEEVAVPIHETGKLVDLDFLMKQTKNNKAFIKEMSEIFVAENPRDLSRLEDAIAKADFTAIYKVAHTIRNTIGFFGLDKMIGSEMLRIEKLAREGADHEEIGRLYQVVKPVFVAAVEELSE